MGMKCECDMCHKAQSDVMDILEVKVYTSTGDPKSVHGAMICPECLKAVGFQDWLHKFVSAGATDLVKKGLEQQAAEQRSQAIQATPDGQPVPIDAKLANRIRNAR